MNTPSSLRLRFGPDWPGRRCHARTRRGTACQKPALRGNARCQLHGARGGAPSGPANGRYRHGRFTKEALAARKARVAIGRAEMAELRFLEKLARSLGMIRD